MKDNIPHENLVELKGELKGEPKGKSEKPIEVYKEIICSEAIHLSRDDCIDILITILRYSKTPGQYVKEYEKEGSRIDLNKLPNSVIIEIYNLVKRRLDLDNI